MKVLVQTLRDGTKEFLNVPRRPLKSGEALVRNHFSAISLGTELSTIKAAKANIIGKIKSRPDQAAQVIKTLKTYGVSHTLNTINKKLDAYSPLGYSSVGEIVDLHSDVGGLSVGDFVACGGVNVAVHASHIYVPKNMMIKIPNTSPLQLAATNSLGAIVLQGIRLATISPGIRACVIGYGVLGQLAATILTQSGVDVVAIDVSSNLADKASKLGHEFHAIESHDQVEREIKAREGWQNGADCVFICASTPSNDPINIAGGLVRQRGEVIVIGDVGTEFKRSPNYYLKEAKVVISCSYGAGRYDQNYEVNGIDFPLGLVRWTSQRNMEAYQFLLRKNPEIFEKLIDRTTDFEDLIEEYDDLEKNGADGFVIVRYSNTNKPTDRIATNFSKTYNKREPGCKNVSVVGPGAYFQGMIMPILQKQNTLNFYSVSSGSGLTASQVAKKFKFKEIIGDFREVFTDENTDIIFCGARHNLHSICAEMALQNNKKLLLEKPLCLNDFELNKLVDLHNHLQPKENLISLGFNRTFSPIYQNFKQCRDNASVLNYQIIAGNIDEKSWQLDPKQGGGRIVGEVCHFIDLCCDFFEDHVNSVYCNATNQGVNGSEDFCISLQFNNGCLANLVYLSSGNPKGPKETITAYSSSSEIKLTDFKTLHQNGSLKKRQMTANKGQTNMVEAFLADGKNSNSDFDHLVHVSKVTFGILKSISESKLIHIE